MPPSEDRTDSRNLTEDSELPESMGGVFSSNVTIEGERILSTLCSSIREISELSPTSNVSTLLTSFSNPERGPSLMMLPFAELMPPKIPCHSATEIS